MTYSLQSKEKAKRMNKWRLGTYAFVFAIFSFSLRATELPASLQVVLICHGQILMDIQTFMRFRLDQRHGLKIGQIKKEIFYLIKNS